MKKVTWSAGNSSSFLNGSRESASVPAAVRAARTYIREELSGEGRATIFVGEGAVRRDERSTATGYRWVVTKICGA